MLAEQKEVKEGRIKLPEVDDAETSVNIGYNFELDYYARNEAQKGAEGDPTFEIDYGNYFTSSSYNIESCLANSGLGIVKSYTMNSDITDSTAGENQQTNASNSGQVAWMKNRLQALFNVLAEASKNKVAKDINASNQVVAAPSGTTIKAAVEKHFDLNAWAEGFIINAVCLPPDVGYSSFYMSFDNSPEGDKKLRFDNPWDFDSNFGNRRGFLEQPDTAGSGWNAKDPYFMDRTANMWLQLLGKMDFLAMASILASSESHSSTLANAKRLRKRPSTGWPSVLTTSRTDGFQIAPELLLRSLNKHISKNSSEP